MWEQHCPVDRAKNQTAMKLAIKKNRYVIDTSDIVYMYTFIISTISWWLSGDYVQCYKFVDTNDIWNFGAKNLRPSYIVLGYFYSISFSPRIFISEPFHIVLSEWIGSFNVAS